MLSQTNYINNTTILGIPTINIVLSLIQFSKFNSIKFYVVSLTIGEFIVIQNFMAQHEKSIFLYNCRDVTTE